MNDEKCSQGNVDGGLNGTSHKLLKQDEMARFVLIVLHSLILFTCISIFTPLSVSDVLASSTLEESL